MILARWAVLRTALQSVHSRRAGLPAAHNDVGCLDPPGPGHFGLFEQASLAEDGWMRHLAPAAMAAGLLASIPILVAPLRGLEPAARADTAAPPALSIEWRQSWLTTYGATRQRWTQELQPLASDPLRHDRELAARIMGLVRALVERYPADDPNSLAAYTQVAQDLANLRPDSRARACLRQLIEEFPGQVGLVTAALDRVVETMLSDSHRRQGDEGRAFAEYALSRVIALQEMGYLAADHRAVERAWWLRFTLCLEGQCYWEAVQALHRLEETGGRSDRWLTSAAEAYLASGRPDLAIPFFQEMGERGEGRIKDLVRTRDARPDFPRDLGLEMKWATIVSRASGTDTANIQALLDESAEAQGLMPGEGGRPAAIWVLADRLLSSQKPEVLAPLRQAQQRQAEDLVGRARRAGDPAAIVALFRRFPWAASVHEVLVAAGEDCLRRGQLGAASRLFEDVLAHCQDGQMRAKAQVGLWLAIVSETSDPEVIAGAFADVPQGALFPWAGERLPAFEICRRLLAGRRAEPEPAATLAGLTLQTLRVPPVLPWNLTPFQRSLEGALRSFPSPLGSVQADGRHTLVAGPNLMACFGEDVSRPLWWRTRNEVQGGQPRRQQRDGGRGERANLAAVPGLFQPAMTDRRIYARWGVEPTGLGLRGLAAFDADTGEILWSTDDDSAWDEIWPASDPVAADGRLYILTIQDKVGPFTPVHLTCLDGERGTLLWQRALGSQSPGLMSIDGRPHRQDRPMEMVRYGNAVTVHRGAVYAATNLGFVARCDVRDGMVEWVSTYPRVCVGSNLPAILRRAGSAPVLVGGHVVCMPRDYQGVFALDGQTGRTVWDVPLLPADESVGVAGGALVLRGDDRLLAVDAASGRVLWDKRFAEGIRGRAALAGGMVYVAAGGALVRLDARTGAILEERRWDAGDPPQVMAIRGGRVLALSEASAGLERPGPVSAPAADAPALAVPLKRAWTLARPEAEIWLPPPEAKVPEMFFLASHGLVEGIRTRAPAGPVWQRFAMSDAEGVLWSEGCMILACDRRVLALDAATGALKWQCEAPWRIGAKKVFPPYLVLARQGSDPPPQVELALVDLATGRLLWSRAADSAWRYFRLGAIGSDGRNLHVFGEAWEPGNPRLVEAVIRTSDGETTAVRPVLPDEAERPMRIAWGDGFGFCLTEWRTLYEFSLAGGPAVRRPTDLKGLADRDRAELKVTGEWLQVTRRNPFPAFRQWILRRGDPSYELRLEREGMIRQGAVYTRDGRAVTGIDLATKKTVKYEIPAVSGTDQFRAILDLAPARDRLWVLSIRPDRGGGPAVVAADLFDRAAGAHLQSQALPGVLPMGVRGGWDGGGDDANRPAATLAVWADKAVYLTDPRGLHALVTGQPSDTIEHRRYIVPMPSRPIVVDGGLEDWDDAAGVPLAGPPERQGRLYLAHDAANLYLAVRYRDRDFLPCVGADDTAGGDWLEIALSTNRESHRFAVGLNPRGRATWQDLGDMPLPKGLRGAVRHDPAAGLLTYEVGIPWAELTHPWSDPRKMGLSVAVWDEEPASGGSARLLTWGEGLGLRYVVPAGHQAIYLYPLTRTAADTMLTLVDELPELPESFDYFLEWSAIYGESVEGVLDLYADFIRRHPKSITVQRLLTLDRNLRTRRHADPGPALLEAARKAGVPAPVCCRYEAESKAYLSQWVYVEPGRYPRSIVLELDDGLLPAPAGWNHRVYWIKPYWTTPRPAFQAIDQFPQGKWHEIRVPLSVLAINDTPIVGISFNQQGEPRLVWDRTAIVYDGQEEVLLDDALPEAYHTGGTWEWVDSPVHSGSKAHRDGLPDLQRYDVANRWVTDFKKPALLHVRPPPEGPYISQWVYLDPLSPPKAISVGLHDGRTWRFHAIWGEKTVHGRAMGPLPPAGAWHELRLPLAWTPLAAEPIAGFAFAQQGGRALWDRTALVAGGRERVIVDDQAPPGPASGPAEAWAPWADRYHGATRPVPGKVGTAMECDGRTGYYEAEPSLEIDTPEITVEAWICMKQYPWTGMGRRWIVSKNMNDEYESHYGLLVFRSGASAFLNIGGTKADAYEAQSEQGLVKLGCWHHAAMTYDGRDLKVYLDGREVGSRAIDKKRVPGTAPLFIGCRQDERSHFPGAIDEVRIYERALSEQEVRARYEAGGGPPTGEVAAALTGHWGFDDDVVRVDDKAWLWVDYTAKSGKRAHGQAPADGYAAHGCMLGQPLVEHLPYDRDKTLAALRRHIPNLGTSEEAWRLLGRLAGLEAAPLARAGVYRWFLSQAPDHPRTADALKALADVLEDLRRADPSIGVEARVRELDLPPDVLYAYRRQYTYPDRLFLRQWQVLGPLPNPEGRGNDTPQRPPESEGINLEAGYDGVDGKVQWQLHESPTPHVNLKALFTRSDQVLAYAVSWVRSETAQPAVLEVGCDDACKVWLNRQLVVEAAGVKSLVPGSKVVRVNLRAGWNELLVKSGNVGGEWAFIVELADPTGRGPPRGLEISTMPPPTAP